MPNLAGQLRRIWGSGLLDEAPSASLRTQEELNCLGVERGEPSRSARLTVFGWTPSSAAMSFTYTSRFFKAWITAKSSLLSMPTSRGNFPGRYIHADVQGTS